MKRFILLVFVLAGCAVLHADTTDVYRVSFRGIELGTFTEHQVINVVVKTDSVFSNDTLKVQVMRDHPCSNCSDYTLMIFGSKGPMLLDSTQNSANFYIPMKPLVEYRRLNGTKQFNGYYTEYREGGKSKVVSFKITLE